MKRSSTIVNVHTHKEKLDAITIHLKSMDLLESTVAGALARVDTEALTCVSLPSIGLREMLGFYSPTATVDETLTVQTNPGRRGRL